MLSDSSGRPLPLEIGRRNSLTSFNDSRPCDRDYKRRKMEDDPYIVSGPRSYRNSSPLNPSRAQALRRTMTPCPDHHP